MLIRMKTDTHPVKFQNCKDKEKFHNLSQRENRYNIQRECGWQADFTRAHSLPRRQGRNSLRKSSEA